MYLTIAHNELRYVRFFIYKALSMKKFLYLLLLVSTSVYSSASRRDHRLPKSDPRQMTTEQSKRAYYLYKGGSNAVEAEANYFHHSNTEGTPNSPLMAAEPKPDNTQTLKCNAFAALALGDDEGQDPLVQEQKHFKAQEAKQAQEAKNKALKKEKKRDKARRDAAALALQESAPRARQHSPQSSKPVSRPSERRKPQHHKGQEKREGSRRNSHRPVSKPLTLADHLLPTTALPQQAKNRAAETKKAEREEDLTFLDRSKKYSHYGHTVAPAFSEAFPEMKDSGNRWGDPLEETSLARELRLQREEREERAAELTDKKRRAEKEKEERERIPEWLERQRNGGYLTNATLAKKQFGEKNRRNQIEHSYRDAQGFDNWLF